MFLSAAVGAAVFGGGSFIFSLRDRARFRTLFEKGFDGSSSKELDQLYDQLWLHETLMYVSIGAVVACLGIAIFSYLKRGGRLSW